MKALAAVVFLHLAVSLVHGAAHQGARVELDSAGMLFVYVVIMAGPLVGIALTMRSPQVGSSIVAITMAASLVFGLVNHFIIQGADHVAHVDAAWRPLFTSSAVLLVVVEATGAVVGARGAIRARRRTS